MCVCVRGVCMHECVLSRVCTSACVYVVYLGSQLSPPVLWAILV